MKTTIYNQHSENTDWQNKLSFYKDELKIMQERLEEISKKNTSKEVMKEVEHFQNQFIIQNDNISRIARSLKSDEKKLQDNIKRNPVAVDHRKAEDHSDERNTVQGFENNFESLRRDYNNFLSKRL